MADASIFEESLRLHYERRGKWGITAKVDVKSRRDLSLAYTPGVAAVCEAISKDRDQAYPLTLKGNSVAIVSNGTAVLGLGNIGPEAALPVMEGKAILFKEFADIDGVPLVVDAKTPEEMIAFVKAVAPTFGGVNLEDIAAPDCFIIEKALQEIGIPVFHDDQHGTAFVLLAALINACKVTGRQLRSLKVVINGAGAAGTAIARLLRCVGHDPEVCVPVEQVYICDSQGIISRKRGDLNSFKQELLNYTNRDDRSGGLTEALDGVDAFIGVSKGNILQRDDIRRMAPNPIVLAMANPIPEIMPDEAIAGGAAVVGTGRSDFPNQVNNLLAFPGVFRGALDARADRITEKMKIAAAFALAESIDEPSADRILPDPLDRSIAAAVAKGVKEAVQ